MKIIGHTVLGLLVVVTSPLWAPLALFAILGSCALDLIDDLVSA